MNVTLLTGIISSPLFILGCTDVSYSTTVYPMAKITGTAPDVSIEAFCADETYTKASKMQNNTTAYPFEISVPENIECRLMMTSNENNPADRVVSQIEFNTESTSGPTFILTEDIDIGYISLPENPSSTSVNTVSVAINSSQISINDAPISAFDTDHNGDIDAYEDKDNDGTLDALEPDYVPPTETTYIDEKGSSDDTTSTETTDIDDDKGSSDDATATETTDIDDDKGSSDDATATDTTYADDDDDDKGSTDNI